MRNSTILIKVKQRLNKLDSDDYDNIEVWQIQEAFNKEQIEWVRRQLHGTNAYKESNEQSIRRIDDLQILLKSTDIKEEDVLKLNSKKYISFELPDDYLEYKRVSCIASKDECSNRDVSVYLAQESDVDVLLQDSLSNPSFEWVETFATLLSGHVKVYTDNKFDIDEVSFTYYRFPVDIVFKDSMNIYTEEIATADVECEFKDDIIELIIDGAVSILSGDIENTYQYQRNSSNSEKNN